MNERYMKRLVGKYCKIVAKEPGEKRANVVIGTLEGVDYNDGFVMINSKQGLGVLRINTIVAIKPKSKDEKHREYKKTLKKDETGMVGIGTLIVFIAMVLIAAVAASVLIQTSETLQQRARSVGMQTIREVSAGLTITDITGYTNENKTKINYMAIMVRPRSGSKDIDLSLCTLTAQYDDLRVLKLNESLVTTINTDNKSLFNTPISAGSSNTILSKLTNTTFGAIAIHDPDNTITTTNGLNRGDRIYILINLSAVIGGGNNTQWNDTGLPPRQTITGSMQPETGAGAVYDITAPAVYAKRIIDLW